MDTLLQDLRYAARQLLRNRGFTIVAVLTLTLGIGANTAIFSVVDGVLLRPAPFTDMGRLVMVWETDRKSGTTREPASIPDWQDLRQRSTRTGQLTAFAAAEVNLTPEGGDPVRLAAVAASHEFLPLLGIGPLVGRTFTEDEDRPGGPPVVLISEDLWEQQYARDPRTVGRTIRINDVPRTIVGVLPAAADFGTLQILGAAAYGRSFADHGGRPRVDVWVPLRADPATSSRDNHPIFLMGRLHPAASVAVAQRELEAVAADLEATYPSNDARGVFVEPLARVIFGPVKPALLVLLGAVTLVMLVACVNVANLLLARGAARSQEVVIRAALGAGARRLARQFLVEGAVLAGLGALLGVILAFEGLRLLLALAPASIPRVSSVVVDARVLGATVIVTALVALAFGLVPTLQARGLSLQGGSARGASAGRQQRRFRSALVVSELALAVMLMVGAGLLIRSLWRLEQVDPGFRTAGVLKAEYQLPSSRYPQNFANYPQWSEIQRFTGELRRRLAALPGVAAVAVAGNHPLDAGFTSSIRVVGREAEAADWPEPSIREVDGGYFEAMRVPLLDGRAFEESDAAVAPPVTVVNEAARRRFFAGGSPIGQRIRLWGAERTVIGVVGNERFHGLAEETPPAVYLPLAQAPAGSGSLLVRARGDAVPAGLATAVRGIVRDLDPALPLFGMEPLAQTVVDSLGQRRFTMIVLGVFAAVALLLAIVGVHGVLTYTVARRTREIGIRMALGADSRGVRTLVVTEGARLIAGGLALGLAGALTVTRVLSTLLYGVGTRDPVTFVSVAGVLGVVALIASYLPARRAARVDPMIALRNE